MKTTTFATMLLAIAWWSVSRLVGAIQDSYEVESREYELDSLADKLYDRDSGFDLSGEVEPRARRKPGELRVYYEIQSGDPDYPDFWIATSSLAFPQDSAATFENVKSIIVDDLNLESNLNKIIRHIPELEEVVLHQLTFYCDQKPSNDGASVWELAKCPCLRVLIAPPNPAKLEVSYLIEEDQNYSNSQMGDFYLSFTPYPVETWASVKYSIVPYLNLKHGEEIRRLIPELKFVSPGQLEFYCQENPCNDRLTVREIAKHFSPVTVRIYPRRFRTPSAASKRKK